MTLALVLTVRDEADIIEAAIRYHLQAGVDRVYVAERHSQDSTREILEALAGQDERVALFRRSVHTEPPEDHREQHTDTSYGAQLAHRDGFDWVLAGDADEFWYHCLGLAHVFKWAETVGLNVVYFEITEFCPPRAPDYPPTMAWPHRRNWRGNISHPKVAFRAHPLAEVNHGNRKVQGIGRQRSGELRGAEILHLPFRSVEQMRSKAYHRVNSSQPYSRELYLVPWRAIVADPLRQYSLMARRATRDGVLDHRLVECLELARAPVPA